MDTKRLEDKTGETVFNNTIDTIIKNFKCIRKSLKTAIYNEDYREADRINKTIKEFNTNLIDVYVALPFTERFVKQAYKILYKGDYYDKRS